MQLEYAQATAGSLIKSSIGAGTLILNKSWDSLMAFISSELRGSRKLPYDALDFDQNLINIIVWHLKFDKSSLIKIMT